jgi:translocation and assembly module TamB
MIAQTDKPRSSWRLWAGAALLGAGLLALVLAGWFLRTPLFRGWVRARVVAALERVTGGQVELESLTWNLAKLEFDARRLIVHGAESPGQVPYLSVDRLWLRLQVLSLLWPKIGLRYVEVEHPVVHLIVYPDGATNQPAHRLGKTSWFAVNAHHAEVHDGLLLVNDRPLPLNFTAEDLSFGMNWQAPETRYDGVLRVGKLQGAYGALGQISLAATARFSLWSDRMRVDALEISSGGSHLRASGELRHYHAPAFELSYAATLEAAQLGSVLRIPALRTGTLQLSGRGNGTALHFSTGGALQLHEVSYVDHGFRLAGLSGSSGFALDEQRLALPQISLHILGGDMVGQGEIRQWRSPSDQSATFALQGHDLSLRQILRVFTADTEPLDQLRLSGAARSSLLLEWKRSPADLAANWSLKLEPPAHPSADELPAEGQLEGVYDRRSASFTLKRLNLATRATRLSAGGVLRPAGTNLHAAGTNLHFTLETGEFNQWAPAIAALGGPSRSLFDVHGQVVLNASLTGRAAKPALAGRLELSDFDSLVARNETPSNMAEAHPSGPGPRIHWDTLTANIECSPARITVHNAILKRGLAQVNFEIAASPEKGRLTPNSPFTAQAAIHRLELSDALLLAGYRYPITGTLDGNLRLSGTSADPQGEASVLITSAHVYGAPVQRIKAATRLARHEIQFTAIKLTQDKRAVATGEAVYSAATGAYHFQFQGSNVDLAKIPWLQTSRTSLSGTLDFSARGSGTTAAPQATGTVQLRDVAMNGERVGSFHASMETAGDTLRLTGHSEFQQSELDLSGTVRLRDDWPAKIALRFQQVDVDPLIRMYLKGKITGHSSLAGTVAADFPLRSPHDLALTATIDRFSAEIEQVQLRNEGPIRFTYAQETLRLEPLRLVGTDTTLDLSGSTRLGVGRALNLQARGQVNLKLLESMNPSIVSDGLVTLDLRIAGTMARPLVNGRVEVAHASISEIELPNGLSDLNGRLLFTEDRLQVQNLTGKTGGGTLVIRGFVSYANDIVFNLRGRGQDIRLRYPPGMSAMANADLRLTGTAENALLSGDITVSRFGVNRQFDFASYLTKSERSLTIPDPSSPLAHLRLDAHIVSPPELQVQTSLAKLSGDVDVYLRGTGTHPVLLGRVNITEGDIFFNGNKYHLEHGTITLSNPASIQPILDLEATTSVRNYDIALGLHGPLDKLSTTYRSDPPLATADVVSLLAFGRMRDQSASQSQQNVNGPAPETQTVLYEALNAAVSSRVQKLFGVSRIKIDPQAVGVQNTSSPRLTIEQQVANNITLTYITDVARTNYQTIQAEYNLNKNVSIVAVRDWTGIVSFDVRVRQRKR